MPPNPLQASVHQCQIDTPPKFSQCPWSLGQCSRQASRVGNLLIWVCRLSPPCLLLRVLSSNSTLNGASKHPAIVFDCVGPLSLFRNSFQCLLVIGCLLLLHVLWVNKQGLQGCQQCCHSLVSIGRSWSCRCRAIVILQLINHQRVLDPANVQRDSKEGLRLCFSWNASRGNVISHGLWQCFPNHWIQSWLQLALPTPSFGKADCHLESAFGCWAHMLKQDLIIDSSG